MAAGKKQYVYRLMKAKCSCGDSKFEQYLNLPTDHGVIYHDSEHPLMNANDHVANENILTFGRCKSISNPGGVIAETIASVAIPFIGGAILQKTVGCKCEPMTITPWINVDEDYFIDGAPALTLESKLPCYYGGTISIVLEKVEEEETDQEAAEDEVPEEEKDVKEQLPSEVQEKIESFTDQEATNPQSAGEDAIMAEVAAKEAEIKKMLSIFDDVSQQQMIEINSQFLGNWQIQMETEGIAEKEVPKNFVQPDFWLNNIETTQQTINETDSKGE